MWVVGDEVAKWRVLGVGWSRKAGVVSRVGVPMGCGMRREGLELVLDLCVGCVCGAQESLGLGREFVCRDVGRVVGVWGGVGAGAWSVGLDV